MPESHADTTAALLPEIVLVDEIDAAFTSPHVNTQK
jgi:hypothetical protein